MPFESFPHRTNPETLKETRERLAHLVGQANDNEQVVEVVEEPTEELPEPVQRLVHSLREQIAEHRNIQAKHPGLYKKLMAGPDVDIARGLGISADTVRQGDTIEVDDIGRILLYRAAIDRPVLLFSQDGRVFPLHIKDSHTEAP